MTARDQQAVRRPRTLADLYEDRDLTPSQVRRIVTVLGLATPRGKAMRAPSEAA